MHAIEEVDKEIIPAALVESHGDLTPVSNASLESKIREKEQSATGNYELKSDLTLS